MHNHAIRFLGWLRASWSVFLVLGLLAGGVPGRALAWDSSDCVNCSHPSGAFSGAATRSAFTLDRFTEEQKADVISICTTFANHLGSIYKRSTLDWFKRVFVTRSKSLSITFEQFLASRVCTPDDNRKDRLVDQNTPINSETFKVSPFHPIIFNRDIFSVFDVVLDGIQEHFEKKYGANTRKLREVLASFINARDECGHTLLDYSYMQERRHGRGMEGIINKLKADPYNAISSLERGTLNEMKPLAVSPTYQSGCKKRVDYWKKKKRRE